MAVKVVSLFARYLDRLDEAGLELITVPQAPGGPNALYPDEELGERCREADILVGDNRHYLNGAILDRIPNLRAIIVPFIGVDKIDVPAATARNIFVVNSPTEMGFIQVAEAAMLLMLALNKRLHHEENLLRAGKHGGPDDMNDVFMGRTVGILGFGRIGKHMARRLQGWEVRVITHDPYVTEVPDHLRGLVELVSLETLLRESDFLTVHAVHTDETRHMIGTRELAMMKPTAYIINTARGAVCDEEAIADAIEKGVIRGAGLDAFEVEPLPLDSRLRTLDPERVILTPHNLPHSAEGIAANMAMFYANVVALAEGQVPEQVVNKEAIPGWQKRFAVAVK